MVLISDNGVGVGSTSQKKQHMAEDGISTAICQFIFDAKYDQLNENVIVKTKELVLDLIGIAAGAGAGGICESTAVFLKAVEGLGGKAGNSTVFTHGSGFSPQYAGLMNAALAHSFDFDDTHVGGVLHPGASVTPAALAQGELIKCDGKTLLLGIAVGYEVACRVGRGYNSGGIERGFHNTGTAGIFGAVAAIAKIKGLSLEEINNAIGLAVSLAAGSQQFLDNGAWNKRLHPGLMVHNAFLAIAFAEAGVVGAARPLEGRYGALRLYSTHPSTEGMIDNLGSEWIFLQTAIKPFPACRMTHAAIDIISQMAKEVEGKKTLEKITVALSPHCWEVVGTPNPNKVHAKNTVDGQFSIYYQAAIAWQYGALGWNMYDKEKMEDPRIAELCDKIESVVNDRVARLETAVWFKWTDGTTTLIEQAHPLGETQNPLSKERIYGKFFGMVLPDAYDQARAEAIRDAVESIDALNTIDLMKLL
ncbi:MmgE/PrpD family protein [Xylariaceae sp. FL0255]|nr:MmgE/PrpD family protein [Xylariaceae sp. FL0255]